MNSNFTIKYMIQTQRKKNSFRLQRFNNIFLKYNQEWVNQEITPLTVQLSQYCEKIQFNIMKQSGSDIVLRIL